MKKAVLFLILFGIHSASFAASPLPGMMQMWSAAGGDVTPPAYSSGSANADACTITLTEDVVITLLDDGDFVMTGSTTGAQNLNSCTEDAGVISCTSATAFVNGETITLAYSGTTDPAEVADLAGNPLATFSGSSVQNDTPSATSYAVHIEFDADTNWGDAAYTLGGNDYSVGADQEATVTGLTQSSGWSVSGSYSASIGASDQRMHLDITTKDVFQGLQGAYEATLYMTAATGDTSFFEAYSTSANYLNFYTSGSNPPAITMRHSGNSVNVIWTTTATCTLSQACQIQILWDANNSFDGSTDGMAARVCSDGTCDSESWEYPDAQDSDPVTNFTAEPTVLRFVGENGSPIGWNDTILVDDVSIWLDHTGANGPSWGF